MKPDVRVGSGKTGELLVMDVRMTGQDMKRAFFQRGSADAPDKRQRDPERIGSSCGKQDVGYVVSHRIRRSAELFAERRVCCAEQPCTGGLVVRTFQRRIIVDHQVYRTVEAAQIIQIGETAVGRERLKIVRRYKIGIDKKSDRRLPGGVIFAAKVLCSVCEQTDQGRQLQGGGAIVARKTDDRKFRFSGGRALHTLLQQRDAFLIGNDKVDVRL